MNNELLKQTDKNLFDALRYYDMGFSIIPICTPIDKENCVQHGRCKTPGKNPLVQWARYQTERASKEQINEWSKQFPDASIGIVTGKISNIVVIDVEAGGKIDFLPPTAISETGGGGWHFYYKHPGHTVKNAVRIAEKTDIRGDGGFVVAPPSKHKLGKRYNWSVSPEMTDLAELPHWVLEKTNGVEVDKVDWKKFVMTGNAEGSRNMSATQLAGKLLYHLPQELWETAGWTTIKEWNQINNIPPLVEQELRAVWESIKKAETEERASNSGDNGESSKKTQAALLLELIEKKGITFFHNELKEPFVVLPIAEHREVWLSRSRMLKRWLAKEFWNAFEKTINSDALNNALNIIEGKACFEEEERILTNRVAWFENAIWYDLTNSEWSAVKINESGWQVVKNPPVLFRRYAHQQEQVLPTARGDAKKICEFVNIKNDGQKLLFMVYLISCFIPDFPHPVLSVYGAQGSAKSMLCKFLRKLIDPSSVEVASFPKDVNELVQILSHHWCIFFDNISFLPGWISDMLCKAASGDGFSKRELFSDDDDIIYTFKRCIGINGINLVVSKPDLLERSILLELDRVPQNQRKQEKELLEEFKRQRPYILGGILDTVAKALKIRPTITLTTLPRMADFEVWGCAIAEALGHTQKEFIQAYDENINHQNEQVLSESLIALAVRAMFKDISEWEGTPSELLDTLTKTAKEQGINTDREKDWPKAANTLSRRLNELKTNLAVDGIQFRRFEKEKKRFISLRKQSENIVETVETTFVETIRTKSSNDSTSDTATQSSPENSTTQRVKNDSDDKNDIIINQLEF